MACGLSPCIWTTAGTLELAVANIEKFLKKLEIDLYSVVLDWEEFRDLQVAFLRASVSDAEIPTDHAIGGVLYKVAAKRGISYVISGTNFATEGISLLRGPMVLEIFVTFKLSIDVSRKAG